MKIAATVVLYNPVGEVISNLQTYLPLVERLYVMDNSDRNYDQVANLKALDKVVYVAMQGNQGIGKALKMATEMAIADGYDFILTMDQDSKYPADKFEYIRNYLATQDLSMVGCIGLNHSDTHIKPNHQAADYVEEKNTVITSGMIIVLNNYQKIAGFREDLFIYYVDNDLCGQFRSRNFKVLWFRNIVMQHQIGGMVTFRCLFFKREVHPSNALACYYLSRNHTYLLKEHRHDTRYLPSIKESMLLLAIKNIIKSKNKVKTIKMFRLGKRHGKQGILGKYQG